MPQDLRWVNPNRKIIHGEKRTRSRHTSPATDYPPPLGHIMYCQTIGHTRHGHPDLPYRIITHPTTAILAATHLTHTALR